MNLNGTEDDKRDFQAKMASDGFPDLFTSTSRSRKTSAAYEVNKNQEASVGSEKSQSAMDENEEPGESFFNFDPHEDPTNKRNSPNKVRGTSP